MRTTIVLAAVLLAACSNGTEPGPQFGELKHRIIEGEQHTVIAGTLPEKTVDLAYREQLAVAPAVTLQRLAERVFLPPYAYAQGPTNIRVQPGAVVCADQSLTDLKPRFPCVTADALGQARFDWIEAPTRVGSYKARVGAAYGPDTTTLLEVSVVVTRTTAKSNFIFPSESRVESPSLFGLDSVPDLFDNPIKWRIIGDGRLQVQGDTAGTAAARTVVFTAGQVDSQTRTLDMQDDKGVVVGKIRYKLEAATRFGQPITIIRWTAYGLGVVPQ